MKKIALCGILFLLASCVLPEKFTSSLTLLEDGSFQFKYQGTINYVMENKRLMAQMSKASGEKLSNREKKEIHQPIIDMQKSPEVKSLKALGNGLYQLDYQINYQAEKLPAGVTDEINIPNVTIPFVTVKSPPYGAVKTVDIRIRYPYAPDYIEKLYEAGFSYQPRGQFVLNTKGHVKVINGLQPVVKNNIYTWKIEKPEDLVLNIQVSFKK